MEINELINSVLYVLIFAVVGIATKFLITLIQRGVVYINEKIDTIKNENFREYCKELMEAVESKTTDLIKGPEKKALVAEQLMDYAQKKNIPVTKEQCDNLIQAIFQQLDGITLNKYKNPSNASLETIITETITRTLISTDLIKKS